MHMAPEDPLEARNMQGRVWWVTTLSAGVTNIVEEIVKEFIEGKLKRATISTIQNRLTLVADSVQTNRRQALRVFFDYNSYNLNVQDPAGYGGDLSSYLTPSARTEANQRLVAARDRADLALAAEARGDHKEAIRQWHIILGSRFPIS